MFSPPVLTAPNLTTTSLPVPSRYVAAKRRSGFQEVVSRILENNSSKPMPSSADFIVFKNNGEGGAGGRVGKERVVGRTKRGGWFKRSKLRCWEREGVLALLKLLSSSSCSRLMLTLCSLEPAGKPEQLEEFIERPRGLPKIREDNSAQVRSGACEGGREGKRRGREGKRRGRHGFLFLPLFCLS